MNLRDFYDVAVARGEDLLKAARRRPAPGQMSLFDQPAASPGTPPKTAPAPDHDYQAHHRARMDHHEQQAKHHRAKQQITPAGSRRKVAYGEAAEKHEAAAIAHRRAVYDPAQAMTAETATSEALAANQKAESAAAGRSRPADKAPGAGWQNIPGGKVAGGKRRRKGSGWEYWYPGKGVRAKPHAEEPAEVHREHVEDQDSTGGATYTYGAYHRPVSSITVPKDYVTTGDHGDFKKFGTVTYNRPLTMKERSHYSLKLIPTADQVDAIAREISADLEDYAAEYLEGYDDDPKTLEISIGWALDKLDVNVRREDMVPLVVARLREVAKAKSDKTRGKDKKKRKTPDREKKPALVLTSPAKAEQAKAGEDERYATTGYVFGSRAELHDLRTQGLLEADPAVAAQLVTKRAVLGGDVTVESFALERDKGVEPAAAYLKYQLMKAIQDKPPDSPVMRERFVEGIGRLQASLAECHTLEDVQTFMGEWKDTMEGRSQFTVVTREQMVKDGFEALTKPPPAYTKPDWGAVWERHYEKALAVSKGRYGPSQGTINKYRDMASAEYHEMVKAAQQASGYADYLAAGADFREYLKHHHGDRGLYAEKRPLPDGSIALWTQDESLPSRSEQLEIFQALGKRFTSLWGKKIEHKKDYSVSGALQIAVASGKMTRAQAHEAQEKARVIDSERMASKFKEDTDNTVRMVQHLSGQGSGLVKVQLPGATPGQPYTLAGPGGGINYDVHEGGVIHILQSVLKQYKIRGAKVVGQVQPEDNPDAAWAHWTGQVAPKKKGKAAATKEKKPDYHALLSALRGDQQKFTREGGPPLPEATTVSSEEFKAKYGLREAEYGRNAADPVREFHTQGAYTALHDLADVLGLKPADMGRKGRLTIGFASRGKGGRAAATYNGSNRVINMTALSGKGSLAHEWGHFMDHMISHMAHPEIGEPILHTDLSAGKPPTAVQESVMSPTSGPRKALNKVDPKVVEALEGVMSAIMHEDSGPVSRSALLAAANAAVDKVNNFRRKGDYSSPEHNKALEEAKTHRRRYNMANPYRRGGAVEVRTPTGFYQAAQKMGDYWSRPHEMFARSFEAWISDELASQGRKNTYLTKGTDAYPDHPGYFPSGEHRKKIGRHMRVLVEALKASGQFQKALQEQVDSLLKAITSGPRLTMRGCR